MTPPDNRVATACGGHYSREFGDTCWQCGLPRSSHRQAEPTEGGVREAAAKALWELGRKQSEHPLAVVLPWDVTSNEAGKEETRALADATALLQEPAARPKP